MGLVSGIAMKQCVTVEIVPVLRDNFVYVVRHKDGCFVVDAGEAGPVVRHLATRGLNPRHLLITHDHHDHIGGLVELRAATGATVWAPEGAAVPAVDRRLRGGEVLDLDGVRVETIWTPGHRPAHLAFHLPEERVLFSGDTLMGAGCGRTYDLPPEQLWSSLQRLARLPDDTHVYFGHEYTETNLRFALTVEPDNDAIRERLAVVAVLRAAGRPSVPTRLADEKATNPFVRAASPAQFLERRRAKDVF